MRARGFRLFPGSDIRRWQCLLAAATLACARLATAELASDKPAAILVYPVILVSDKDCVDTTVQISNTSTDPIDARCFYVNATGRCSNNGRQCFTGAECGGGFCVPTWRETDFRIRLTARQPVIWLASEGLSTRTAAASGLIFPLDGITRKGQGGQSNAGSLVPPVSDNPFLGELKCIAVDDQDRPTDRNVLVGSAITEELCPNECLDVTRHNAIGIQAIPGANNGDNTLVLGQEYEACPNTLIMNHFFDGAADPATGDEVVGNLTLVPCSEDFVQQDQNLAPITAQFLVYNEFEQRFSTSTRVECYASLPLSNIDTTQPERSIFSVGVAGTLTGQTRIRGVGITGGHGLLGVYFDMHGVQSTAANLHFQGIQDQVDLIHIP